MSPRWWLVPAFLIASGATAGEPSLTDPSVPSPTAEAARRWLVAAFQAPLLDYYDPGTAGSEAARMLATVQRGDQLRSGVGWYGPGQGRHGWAWFAARFDADRDGKLSRLELKGDPFLRLDRDRDGVVTADDFDWSDRSAWARQSGVSLRFFRAIDENGNGKVSEEEMLDYFRKLSKEKGYLQPDDLQDALLRATAAETRKGKAKEKRVPDQVWLRSLLAGDLGSAFDGPRVGDSAPDFTLPTQDGKRRVTLSECRGKPTVLIFGSFT
jgi:hypothetical protein